MALGLVLSGVGDAPRNVWSVVESLVVYIQKSSLILLNDKIVVQFVENCRILRDDLVVPVFQPGYCALYAMFCVTGNLSPVSRPPTAQNDFGMFVRGWDTRALPFLAQYCEYPESSRIEFASFAHLTTAFAVDAPHHKSRWLGASCGHALRVSTHVEAYETVEKPISNPLQFPLPLWIVEDYFSAACIGEELLFP